MTLELPNNLGYPPEIEQNEMNLYYRMKGGVFSKSQKVILTTNKEKVQGLNRLNIRPSFAEYRILLCGGGSKFEKVLI